LNLAQSAPSGRSSRTVYGGHEHVLRQTVIALANGQALSEHENPGEATVHVLVGRVRLHAATVDRTTARQQDPPVGEQRRGVGRARSPWLRLRGGRRGVLSRTAGHDKEGRDEQGRRDRTSPLGEHERTIDLDHLVRPRRTSNRTTTVTRSL